MSTDPKVTELCDSDAVIWETLPYPAIEPKFLLDLFQAVL